MEQYKEKKSEVGLDGAVEAAVRSDATKAVEYLKLHPEDITEFCQRVFEAYREGDKTGLIILGEVIKKLIEEKVAA